jgi:hypothetical protein
MDRPDTFEAAARGMARLLWREVNWLWRRRMADFGVTPDDLHAAALVGLWRAWQRHTADRGPWLRYALVVMRRRTLDWVRVATQSKSGAGYCLERRPDHFPDAETGDRDRLALACDPEPEAVEMPERALSRELRPSELRALRLRYFSPRGTTTQAEWQAAFTGQRRLKALGRARVAELLGLRTSGGV